MVLAFRAGNPRKAKALYYKQGFGQVNIKIESPNARAPAALSSALTRLGFG